MTYQGMEEDRRFILASADELEQYLSSAVVLWPLRGFTQPLSPANLLFARFRYGDTIDSTMLDASAKITKVIESNRSLWENRIQKEIPIRLNQYSIMVEEYLDRGAIDAGYVSSISVRVKLELLFLELYHDPAVPRRKTAELDRIFQSLQKRGEFIWEDTLSGRFPREKFGYLYVSGK
jgi:hypothetical protein